MGDERDVAKPRKGEPAEIPAAEPISDAERERLKARRHEAGLARERAGREGRNDPYIEREGFAPRAQHSHSGSAESKQAGGDASSGPDRVPDTSRGGRRGGGPGRTE